MRSTSQPTVSVAMCTFNGSVFVAEQLESILAQDYELSQIVIADDGSSDSTLEVIRAVLDSTASTVPVEIVARATPLGVSGNFSDALARCTGHIVVLSDQDDRWAPSKVRTMLEQFETDDVMMVASDARLIDGQGSSQGSTLWDILGITRAERLDLLSAKPWRPLLRRNLVTGATAAVRSEVLDLALPVPPAWLHDEWLAMVASLTGRIGLINEPLTDYRLHGANVVGAQERTFKVLLGRLSVDGSKRNARLHRRAVALQAWALDHAALLDPQAVSAIARKLAHESFRNSLSRHRFARLLPVLLRAARGEYHVNGGGIQDIVRDCVQPLRYSDPRP